MKGRYLWATACSALDISASHTSIHTALAEPYCQSPAEPHSSFWGPVPEGYGLEELGWFFTGYKSQANPQIPSSPVRYFTSSPSSGIAELLLQNFSHISEGLMKVPVQASKNSQRTQGVLCSAFKSFCPSLLFYLLITYRAEALTQSRSLFISADSSCYLLSPSPPFSHPWVMITGCSSKPLLVELQKQVTPVYSQSSALLLRTTTICTLSTAHDKPAGQWRVNDWPKKKSPRV